MIGRALDSNNDLILETGSFKIVDNAEETLQHVRTRLLTYQGEWFLNLFAGVPYFQEIFTKPANLANIESIFKTEILETDGVSKLLEFNMDYEGGNERKLTVSFSAETEYGIIDAEELSINV